MNNKEEDWGTRCYESAKNDEPSPGLLKALEIIRTDNSVVTPGDAIDLACGYGRDTRKLLQDGWRVLAVDICDEAVEYMEEACADVRGDRLSIQLGSFGETKWKPAALINAALALPYCPQEEFANVWSKIIESLIPGGLIVADFFGQLPGAPKQEPMVMLLSEEELHQLLSPLKVEFYEEWYGDFWNANGDSVRRVAYTVIARAIK